MDITRHDCAVCSKSFLRVEHLKRHEASHKETAAFECQECSKQFQRRDALIRHEATHREQTPSLLTLKARACAQCAKAKSKCDGRFPCSRCEQRSISCQGSALLTTTPARRAEGVVPHSIMPHENSRSRRSYEGTHEQQTQPSYAPVAPALPLPTAVGSMDMSINVELDVDFWNQDLSAMNWLSDLSPHFGEEVPLDVPSTFVFDTSHETARRDDLIDTINHDEGTMNDPSLPSSRSSKHPAGTYYIDNEAGRLPRGKRRRLTGATNGSSELIQLDGYSLDLANDLPESLGSESSEINDTLWSRICEIFVQLCVTSTYYSSFSSGTFPSRSLFSLLLRQYITSFHPVLPLIHLPSFEVNDVPALLLISMAAIGSHYLVHEKRHGFSVSLHEVVRRGLHHAQENPASLALTPLVYGQVRLLHVVGACYCGDDRMRRLAVQMHQQISEICLDSANQQSTSSRDDWHMWIDRESNTRLHYTAWLLDCMWNYHHTSARSILKLEDAVLQLPCHEKVWAAQQSDWPRIMLSFLAPPTLPAAVQLLHVEKRLPHELGEFSRVLLIHGIFGRSWEVEAYLRQGLSHWTPTAARESLADVQTAQRTWLPSMPLYKQWRSSACDCLDVLHWSANAAIGNASGIEHPTVLHLHLARVILLTPWKETRDLAEALVRGPKGVRISDVPGHDLVRRWAVNDGYKARLAMIHAGVLFWHVRRFSTHAFYEPSAIGLATLALWAFSTFSVHDRMSAATTSHDLSEDEEDMLACNIILLDRPTDDELVQRFVVKGGSMVANLDGIGNLYGAQAPKLILQHGRRILGSLHNSGDTQRWTELLTSLLDAI